MKITYKKKGILFWITGLSGSDKTTLGKKITKEIRKIYGPTIMISGDDIREIFKLTGFDYDDRLEITKKYCQFARHMTHQKINVIFAVVGLMHNIRVWNRKNIKNYI